MKPTTCGNSAAVCLGLLLTGAACSAQDEWPQIRGAKSDGIATNVDPPLEWSAVSHTKWKVAVPVRGHSSPIVSDGRIYLSTAIEENTREEKIGTNMSLVADRITIKVLAYGFDDGKLIWERSLFEVEKPDPVHVLNSFATPTPVAEGKHLCCDFGTYGTACLDAGTGEVVWHKNLRSKFRASPIHAAGRLYLFDTTGTCHVLKPGREFEVLQTNPLDNQELTATPAFVGSSIVIRTHTHLYRIDKATGSK